LNNVNIRNRNWSSKTKICFKRHPIDIGLVENQIKSTFGIEDRNKNEYFIQIYDEQINDYLDLISNSFISTNNKLIKGQINITSIKFSTNDRIESNCSSPLTVSQSVNTNLDELFCILFEY
jgi:hypothetical protein